MDDEPELTDLPEGYEIPKMDRDARGRLLPGHSIERKPKPQPLTVAQQQSIHHQQIKLTYSPSSEIAIKKQALQDAIDESDITLAIRDILKTAKDSENPYIKHMFYNLFFDRILGKPDKSIDITERKSEVKQIIDYSKLSQSELYQLEALATKVTPIP